MIKSAGKGFELFGLSICLAASFLSPGCVYYALPVVTPPSVVRVKIVAKSPDSYVVRINSERSLDFAVASDGRVNVSIPAYRPGCSVYVSRLKVSNGYDPLKDWTVEIRRGDVTVRKLSVSEVVRRHTDAAGFHLIEVG